MLKAIEDWQPAFEMAGFKNAIIAKVAPTKAEDPDFSPEDARYSVVRWLPSTTENASGPHISDPRTGEIIKGMARMDSHRARTDYNLFAALMGADVAAADTAFVLARVRQVSAHEVGHTLGLSHNYIASTNERASVMDYPAPRVRIGPNGAAGGAGGSARRQAGSASRVSAAPPTVVKW